MILRILGGILVITGSLGLGYWYYRQIGMRIGNVEELIRMLDLMMSEIRYSRATLPECCKALAGQMQEPYDRMFQKLSECLQKDDIVSFEAVFEQCLMESLRKTSARQEETEALLRFTRNSSIKDGKMQLLGMERCRQNLAGIKEKLESEAAGKGRMALGLGSLGGLLLLILLW